MHRPAVLLDNGFDDGEPNPQPAVGARRRAVRLAEAFEDERQELRADPPAVIADGHLDIGLDPLKPDFDAPALGRELDRVREQIPDHLLKPFVITGDRTCARVYNYLKAYVLGFGGVSDRIDGGVNDRGWLNRPDVEVHLP